MLSCLIRRRSPDAWTCNAHGSVANSIDGEVAPNSDWACGRSSDNLRFAHRDLSTNTRLIVGVDASNNLRQCDFIRVDPSSGSLRELRCIPTASKSLDQHDASFEASLRDFNVVALVLEQGCLPGDDLKIGIDAIFVTRIEEVKRLLRRGGSVALLACFDLKVVQRVEIVLNLLECGERALAVGSNRPIVLRDGDVGGGAPAPVIEERLG